MLSLPKQTEINKQLAKTLLYSKFNMNSIERSKIDADISKMVLVNEITENTINITKGEKVKSFYVLYVFLKKKDFDENNIIKISKLIPQNILFILEYDKQYKLAIYHNKLLQTNWLKEPTIEIKGLNLDKVWDNIVIDVGNIIIENNNTVDKQMEIDDKRDKLLKEIARLEQKARSEKQPKKKFELVQKKRELEKEINKER